MHYSGRTLSSTIFAFVLLPRFEVATCILRQPPNLSVFSVNPPPGAFRLLNDAVEDNDTCVDTFPKPITKSTPNAGETGAPGEGAEAVRYPTGCEEKQSLALATPLWIPATRLPNGRRSCQIAASHQRSRRPSARRAAPIVRARAGLSTRPAPIGSSSPARSRPRTRCSCTCAVAPNQPCETGCSPAVSTTNPHSLHRASLSLATTTCRCAAPTPCMPGMSHRRRRGSCCGEDPCLWRSLSPTPLFVFSFSVAGLCTR